MNKLNNYLFSPVSMKRKSATKLSQQLGYEFLNDKQFNKWNKKLSDEIDKKSISIDSISSKGSQTEDSNNLDIEEVEREATILMIDDEDVCLYSMEIMLMGTPYSIVTLNKCTEAIEYIYANIDNIDLIFLDLNMPEMNGLELLEEIKSDRMLSCIPVILQSACANDNDIINAYILGISSFLQKPYKKNQVLSAIKGALDDKTK